MYLQKINLKNKYALVTGAGKGLGRACAIALAEAGATVIALSRTSSDLDKLEKEIKKIKGKIVKVNGEKYIEFYGSSSEVANKKHYGGLSDYRSSEGRKVRVKYRGKINDTILNILGGVRSSCTYVGAPSLKQLSKCTTFIRVSNQFNDSLIK